MKIMITILSLLVIFTGLLPFMKAIAVVNVGIPTEGVYYSFIIISLGSLALIYAFINKLLFGVEKFVAATIAALTLFGGLLPSLAILFPVFEPAKGPFISFIIILIGFLGLLYTIMEGFFTMNP